MPRRVFISTDYENTNQARGFKLIPRNPNTNIEFVTRDLLSPVDSQNPDYIKASIKEKLNGTSVTVVLLGQNTGQSEWVRWEAEESYARGNGIIGIRLKGQDDAPVPQFLKDVGAKVVNWDPDIFEDEIDKSALIAGRPELGPAPTRSVSASGCR